MLKIYLSDLSAYNQSHLVGQWVSLPMEPKELLRVSSTLLSKGEQICNFDSKHEELFFTDYEWSIAEALKLNAFDNIYELNETLLKFEALGFERYELKIIYFLLNFGFAKNIEEALEKYENVILYEEYDLALYASDLLHELYGLENLPKIISSNIDFERVARDLQYEGIYFEVDRDIFIYEE